MLTLASGAKLLRGEGLDDEPCGGVDSSFCASKLSSAQLCTA